jgi:hypothetical protein
MVMWADGDFLPLTSALIVKRVVSPNHPREKKRLGHDPDEAMGVE